MRGLGRAGLMLCLALCGLLAGCAEAPKTDPAGQALAEARQAWLAGDFARAESGYQDYLRQAPQGADRLEAWKRLADIAVNVWRNPASGLKLIEAALLESGLDSPERPILWRQGVETALAAKNPDKALDLLSGLAEGTLGPCDRVSVQLLRHQALLAKNEPALAVEALSSCRDSGATPAEAAPCSERLAVLLGALGQTDRAQTVWRALYEDGTVDAKLRARAGFALAEAAEAAGDKARARFLYRAVRDTYPNPQVIQRRLEFLGK